MWYASPSNQGWGAASKAERRKSSIIEADVSPSGAAGGGLKASAGRVIRIINNLDHTVQVSHHPNPIPKYPDSPPFCDSNFSQTSSTKTKKSRTGENHISRYYVNNIINYPLPALKWSDGWLRHGGVVFVAKMCRRVRQKFHSKIDRAR